MHMYMYICDIRPKKEETFLGHTLWSNSRTKCEITAHSGTSSAEFLSTCSNFTFEPLIRKALYSSSWPKCKVISRFRTRCPEFLKNNPNSVGIPRLGSATNSNRLLTFFPAYDMFYIHTYIYKCVCVCV